MKSGHFRLLLATMQKCFSWEKLLSRAFVFTTPSEFCPRFSLKISDLMDTINKLFKRSCCIEDLK